MHSKSVNLTDTALLKSGTSKERKPRMWDRGRSSRVKDSEQVSRPSGKFSCHAVNRGINKFCWVRAEERKILTIEEDHHPS